MHKHTLICSHSNIMRKGHTSNLSFTKGYLRFKGHKWPVRATTWTVVMQPGARLLLPHPRAATILFPLFFYIINSSKFFRTTWVCGRSHRNLANSFERKTSGSNQAYCLTETAIRTCVVTCQLQKVRKTEQNKILGSIHIRRLMLLSIILVPDIFLLDSSP